MPGGNSANNRLYCASRQANKVVVVDCSNNQVVAMVGVWRDPVALLANPAGTSIYCINQAGNSVDVISAAGNTVTDTVVGARGADCRMLQRCGQPALRGRAEEPRRDAD